MYENSKARIEAKHQKIDKQLDELYQAKNKAVTRRIEELENELIDLNRNSNNSAALGGEISEFKNKIKNLYTNIFQGTKELALRKNDLVRQIKGEDFIEQEY